MQPLEILVTDAPLPFALLIAAYLAALVCWRRPQWAGAGLRTFVALAPLVLVLWAMADITTQHRELLGWYGVLPSSTPEPEGGARLSSPAPALLLWRSILLLPLAALVLTRGAASLARALAVGASLTLAFAVGATATWHLDTFFWFSCRLMGCSGPSWYAELELAELQTIRRAIVFASACFGLFACVCALARARRGHVPTRATWAGLVVLLLLGVGLKLWTLDMRRDTLEPFDGRAHTFGIVGVPDTWELTRGPVLPHCRFEGAGTDIHVTEFWYRSVAEEAESQYRYLEHCGQPGPDALLAPPEQSIEAIDALLSSAHAHGQRQILATQLRERTVSRRTSGSFQVMHACVVPFELDPAGVPVTDFGSWGELAEAIDAAEGQLRVAPSASSRDPSDRAQTSND